MLNKISINVVFDRKKVATRASSPTPKKGTVQMAVIINKHRRFISTGVRVYKDQWTGGRVVSMPLAQELNERIDNHCAAVVDIVNQCDRDGKVFSWDMLNHLYVRTSSSASFVEFMERTIKKRPLAEGTKKHHYKVLRFLKRQGITACEHLTRKKIEEIDLILRERNLMQPSIYTYHKTIKTYIRMAIKEDLMEHNPYDKFTAKKGISRPREVLTMDEIRRIESSTPQSIYMQHVRDLFLLQIWTGLSYCDLMAADFKSVVDDTLTGRRGKTDVTYTTIILPQAKKILEKYKYRIPKMAYDDYRRMILPLAEMCGIKKNISTHNGRHTFATTVALGHGVPIEVVSRMLGHKDIKTTQIYAKVQQSMVQEHADRLSEIIAI